MGATGFRLLGIMTVVGAALPASGVAGSLTIADVESRAVACVFNTACDVTVSDTQGAIALPNLDQPGAAVLQSRTFFGAAGAPGAGATAYEYRVDLSQAAGSLECLGGLVVNFGPVKELQYKTGSLAHVYVVRMGGIGTVGLKAAEQDGDVITFEFDKLLCPGQNTSATNSTFLFGLAAATPPKPMTAGVFAIGSPPYISVAARAPSH